LLRRAIIALVMETGSTSETSANVYQTTRRNIPESTSKYYRLRNFRAIKDYLKTKRDVFQIQYGEGN
jgi:hypothetical protein